MSEQSVVTVALLILILAVVAALILTRPDLLGALPLRLPV